MLVHSRADHPHAEEISVQGIVQGVGFRPAVYRLASARGLAGDVRNDSRGVHIRVSGAAAQIEDFIEALVREAPPLARIDSIQRHAIHERLDPGFRILTSIAGEIHTHVSPDAAICEACLADTFDPANRRYRYAFTNCTHCGPRLTIVHTIPYDRPNTSMSAFGMCRDCLDEYHDPADRRFHAQPNACPACGPHLRFESVNGGELAVDSAETMEAITTAAQWIRKGRIVAIKGLGGFHLACNATDAAVVARLRIRKHRDDKPFALMAPDLETIRRYCRVGEAEAGLLQSPEAPIVLLARHGDPLAPQVAPAQTTYGFMLPYTALHHLLMTELEIPIVLTSGNASDEPQCIDNDEARVRLAGIADALLVHDRVIVNRVDDSVVRLVGAPPRPIRRPRGYAPAPLPLPATFEKAPPVLAFGGELKNTFCLVRDGSAILSQHLGDLENWPAYEAYRRTLDFYLELFEHAPGRYAADRHSEYISTKLARDWAAAHDRPLIEVQHHHAHIAACLAENNVELDDPPVLGVALDGLGYGDDGAFWGGEFLCADYHAYQRLAAFEQIAMPGGAHAIREPWRMGYAYLRKHFDWSMLTAEYGEHAFFRAVRRQPLRILDRMIERGINSPPTTSCGRLFDAVAAVIGLRQEVTYEGQAAIELEAAVDPAALADGKAYPLAIVESSPEIGVSSFYTRPMWQALLHDLGRDTNPGVIAARLHNGLAEAITGMIENLTSHNGNPWQGRIALSGGVLQNAVLHERLTAYLEGAGFIVYSPSRVPANDGGLSLGQALIGAAAVLSKGRR